MKLFAVLVSMSLIVAMFFGVSISFPTDLLKKPTPIFSEVKDFDLKKVLAEGERVLIPQNQANATAVSHVYMDNDPNTTAEIMLVVGYENKPGLALLVFHKNPNKDGANRWERVVEIRDEKYDQVELVHFFETETGKSQLVFAKSMQKTGEKSVAIYELDRNFRHKLLFSQPYNMTATVASLTADTESDVLVVDRKRDRFVVRLIVCRPANCKEVDQLEFPKQVTINGQTISFDTIKRLSVNSWMTALIEFHSRDSYVYTAALILDKGKLKDLFAHRQQEALRKVIPDPMHVFNRFRKEGDIVQRTFRLPTEVFFAKNTGDGVVLTTSEIDIDWKIKKLEQQYIHSGQDYTFIIPSNWNQHIQIKELDATKTQILYRNADNSWLPIYTIHVFTPGQWIQHKKANIFDVTSSSSHVYAVEIAKNIPKQWMINQDEWRANFYLYEILKEKGYEG